MITCDLVNSYQIYISYGLMSQNRSSQKTPRNPIIVCITADEFEITFNTINSIKPIFRCHLNIFKSYLITLLPKTKIFLAFQNMKKMESRQLSSYWCSVQYMYIIVILLSDSEQWNHLKTTLTFLKLTPMLLITLRR